MAKIYGNNGINDKYLDSSCIYHECIEVHMIRRNVNFKSWVASYLPLSDIKIKSGNFELKDDGIVIGKNISRVRIYATATWGDYGFGERGDRVLGVLKNESDGIDLFYFKPETGSWVTNGGYCLLDVNENDVIKLVFTSGQNGTIEFLNLTKIIVEKIC